MSTKPGDAGSKHDMDFREHMIDAQEMHICKPFSGLSGVLCGHLVTRERPAAGAL